MKPIQILMDEDLLHAVDTEAERSGSDRSKLMRTALKQYLRRAQRQAWEQQHRAGYERNPQTRDDIAVWETIQAWPEE